MRYGRLLTPEEVRELRILRATTLATFAALGELYGVSESTVSYAVRGRTYLNAGGPVETVTAPQRYVSSHGTASRYTAGCRCPECTTANKASCRAWRERKRKERS